MDDIYITVSGEVPSPIVITTSGETIPPIVISTSESSAPVLAVNGKLGFVILDKSDIGLSNVENLSILGVSGHLQAQIDNLDSGYASQAELNALSGQLVASGSNLSELIYSLSGYSSGQDAAIYINLGQSGQLLNSSIQSLSGSLNSTGAFLAYQIDNSSGYFENLYNGLSSLYYPLSSNPSGYLVSGDLSAYLTGFNSGDYVLKSETGIFATSSDLVSTGLYLDGKLVAASGVLQDQIDNLGDVYVNYGQLTGLSGQLVGQIGQTGANLQSQIDALYNSGYITGVDLSSYVTNSQTGIFYTKDNPSGFINSDALAPYLTGFNSGDYVLKNETGNFVSNYQTGVFATSAHLDASGLYLAGQISTASGTLQNQINNLDSGYASQAELDILSGNLGGTGSFLQSQINNLSSSGFLTGIDDLFVVYQTGDQIISGNKTFKDQVNFSGIKFDLISGTNLPVWEEGKVFYDSDAHTLCYYNDSSEMMVNLGQEQIIRVSNGWTGTILNGMVVQVSGAQGNRPKIFPATAAHTYLDNHDILGVATQEITNQGYVTLIGLVNGLDTSSYTIGDSLYLSTGEYGTYSTSLPEAPNHKVKVGIVTRSHVNQGQIFVKISQAEHLGELNDTKFINVQSGDFIRYSADSGIWYNTPVDYIEKSEFITSGDYWNEEIATLWQEYDGLGSDINDVQDAVYALETETIPSLSGSLDATGILLFGQITGLADIYYPLNSNPSGYLILPDVTGYISGLQDSINNLSGYSNNTFATISNLNITGVTLTQEINNLKNLALAYAIAL